MGMLDNSIIFFTSDHGEMGGEHGLKGKGGLLFERNMHVPLIVYHPDYEGGHFVNAVTSHIYIATTFIHMSGLSAERKAEVAADRFEAEAAGVGDAAAHAGLVALGAADGQLVEDERADPVGGGC